MEYRLHPHKHANAVFNDPRIKPLFDEVLEAIESISDDNLRATHVARKNSGIKSSLAPTINQLLKTKLKSMGWRAESSIFQGPEYGGEQADKVWRLDFAKDTISIEVGFNHGEAIAWNLLKPVLASEVNHVQKAINTEAGIFITTTKALKTAGAFDNAVGEFEKVLRYLIPLDRMLSVPVMIIGLEPPRSFRLKSKYPKCEDWGKIIDLPSSGLVKSPISVEMIRVPLVGSAPCGKPLDHQENIEEYIEVEKSKIKPGFKYFILRAEGDSMNDSGINDGDLVLCRQQEKAETGDRVVALLGGESVTIKEYGPRENGIRLLLPKSTNKSHRPITPGEGDSVQGIVQEILN